MPKKSPIALAAPRHSIAAEAQDPSPRAEATAAAEPSRGARARRVRLLPIYPDGHLWGSFLDRCADYVSETWPEACPPDQRRAFVADMDDQLRARLRQGGRWYFMLQSEGRTQGLANLYSAPLHCPDCPLSGRMSLHVAEFTVFPTSRKAGLGSAFVDALGAWSRLQGLDVLSAEVDDDNTGAHAFWSRQGMRRHSPADSRPVYVRSLASMPAEVDFPVGDFRHSDLCLQFQEGMVVLCCRDKPQMMCQWELEDGRLTLGDILPRGEGVRFPGLVQYFLGRLLHEARRGGARTVILAGAAHEAACEGRLLLGLDQPRTTSPGYATWTIAPSTLLWLRHAFVPLPETTDHFLEDAEISLGDDALPGRERARLGCLAPQPGTVFSSTLQRSRQTAAALVHGTPTTVHSLEGLDEFFPGHLVGMALVAAEKRYGANLLQRLPRLILSESIDNAESKEQARDRLRSACHWIMELPLPHATRLVVGHGLAAEVFRDSTAAGRRLSDGLGAEKPLGCLKHWNFSYDHTTGSFTHMSEDERA